VPEGAANASVAGGERRSREALEPFLARLRDLARRWPGPTLTDQVVADAPSSIDAAPSFHLLNPLIPLRWFEPDNGLPITYLFNPAATPLALPLARAGFAATVENWSHIPGTTVRLWIDRPGSAKRRGSHPHSENSQSSRTQSREFSTRSHAPTA